MQRITPFEREIIAIGLRHGKSLRGIAWSLGRDHTVISREVKRNTCASGYGADRAVFFACRRRSSCKRSKLERHHLLREYVERELREGLSPEQIAGRIKLCSPPELKGVRISHESIYAYIYEGAGTDWWKYLRKKHYTRRKKKGRLKQAKTQIKERISIHARPDHITDRREYGHWEADTLLGTRKRKEGLSVLYERKSQLVSLARVASHSAEETEEALRTTIESYPKPLFKSATFDNGTETANHYIIRREYGIATYHCDPYASWQKGGVENMNGLLREYFPKGSDLSWVTERDLRRIEEKLNNRPRKSLGYKTPNEVIHEYLEQAVH